MKIVFNILPGYDKSIFETSTAKKIIGASWIPMLKDQLRSEGIDVILGNDYLNEGKFSSKDLIISEGVTKNSRRLHQSSATPFLLFSGESPNVDWRFYLFLKFFSKKYRYTMVFSGAQKYVSERSTFMPFHWPNDVSNHFPKGMVAHELAKKIVMVASNKQQSMSARGKAIALTKKFYINLLTKIAPPIRLRDLYKKRLECIQFLANTGKGNLFGKGWNNLEHLSHEEIIAVKKLNPTVITDKYELLTRYNFSICFENCIYPGYLTEKIFDCFLSRCIPIYWGAPDIEKYIPNNCFIDFRKFNNFDALLEYIESMSVQDIKDKIDSIDRFVKSERFKAFTDYALTEKLVALIKLQNR